MTPPDLHVEAWISDEWVNLPLLHEAGCTVEIGRRERADDPAPSTLAGTIKNQTGDFDPGNPAGAYFGSLQEGNPVRARVGVDVYDTIGSRTATDSWGTSTSGHTWTVGTPAGDYDVTGGKALMSIPSANVSRQAQLDGSEGLKHGELRGTVVVLAATAVTGAAISWSVTARATDLTTTWTLKCTLSTTDTVAVSLVDDGGAVLAGPTTLDLTHTAVTGYAYALQVLGHTLRGKVWDSAGTEPQAWQVSTVDTSINASGKWGYAANVPTGNTNTKPFTYQWDKTVLSVPLLAGDITGLAPGWDETGTKATVALDATGLSGRFEQGGESPLSSALYRAYTSGQATNLVAYWPCQDQRGATTLAGGLPDTPAMELTGSPSIAAFTTFDCSSPVPTTSTDSRWAGVVPAYTDTGELTLRWLMHIPAGSPNPTSAMTFHATGTAHTWYVYYNGSGQLFVKVYNAAGTALYTGGGIGYNLDDHPVLCTWRATQNGANIDWDLTVLRTDTGAAGFASDTVASQTLGICEMVVVNRDFNLGGMAVGHIAVQSLSTTVLHELDEPARAHVGETAGRRAERLCGEEGIAFTHWGDLDDTAAMGPQLPRTLPTLLQECAQVEQGTIMDDPGDPGLWFRTYAEIVNQDTQLALDYSAGQLAGRFLPVRDRFGLLNDVTITREHGSPRRAEITAGPRAAAAIGRYDAAWTRNVATDGQAGQLAWWLASAGTLGGDRFPQITLRRTRSSVMATALRLAALGLQPDDRTTVAGAGSINRPDTINLLARGARHVINAEQHQISLPCTPGDPWQVFQVADATYGRLWGASGATELHAAVDDNDTAWQVTKTSGPLWTTDAGDLSIPFTVEGEAVSATDIDTIAVGTPLTTAAVNANNASVTPTIHASAANGDLLVLIAAIRNSGTGTPDTPTGWKLLVNAANVRIYGAIKAAVADAATYRVTGAPTVTFTGGAANATTQAKIIVLPGTWHSVDRAMVAWADSLNTSAQNVAVPGLVIPENNCAVLSAMWKQDDLTSVATLTNNGMTELAEDSTTTGDDQALCVDYVIQTTRAHITPDSFVVTGGAAAISRGIVAAFRCDVQTFTVTRSTNTVVKTHAAGALLDPGLHTGWSYGKKTT